MTALLDLTSLRDVVARTEPGSSGPQFVAVALQALRRASELTPTEFAERANLSLADVGLAELGTVPWHVLKRYLAAADVEDDDRRFVYELWQKMRDRDTPRTTPATRPAGTVLADLEPTCPAPPARRPVTPPRPNLALWPDPAKISDAPQFQSALATIKDSSGVSYARLAKIADGLGYPLPRTTLHNLCTRQRLPVNAEVVATFVTACGADESTAHAWVTAWQRLKTASRGTETPPQTPADPGHSRPVAVVEEQTRATEVRQDADDQRRDRHPHGQGLVNGGTEPPSHGLGVSTTRSAAVANAADESASVLFAAFGTPLIGLLIFFLGLFSGLLLGRFLG
ncbi:hypothetical protein LFM09_42020 [Lentzea alba]|uniref:hypothetical protein n=1 Tax=Lentzea alba TaxID=2714351 RepID=UPI0039BFAE45